MRRRHPFLPYVAPHFSHISHFNLFFEVFSGSDSDGELLDDGGEALTGTAALMSAAELGSTERRISAKRSTLPLTWRQLSLVFYVAVFVTFHTLWPLRHFVLYEPTHSFPFVTLHPLFPFYHTQSTLSLLSHSIHSFPFVTLRPLFPFCHTQSTLSLLSHSVHSFPFVTLHLLFPFCHTSSTLSRLSHSVHSFPFVTLHPLFPFCHTPSTLSRLPHLPTLFPLK